MTTVITPDWDAARKYLDKHTSDAACPLTELTALHDGDLHEIVLDPGTRTVWWAYDNAPLGKEGWTVQQLAPADAAGMASGVISLVQDRMDDPESYLCGGDPDGDQSALDEYVSILALGLPNDPAQARSHIRSKRALIAREDSLWQRVDASLVRRLTAHGGKRAASRVLGITDVQVGRIVRADDQRREAVCRSVEEAIRTSGD